METSRYIAYYRVSTKKQNNSGLGLASQKQSVEKFCEGKIIESYTEVESGKNDNRIELKKAIEAAKKNNAKLVIAKLDRLSRNVTFVSMLMDSGVDFICVDMPNANKLTIHIIAALAQQERELISIRTKQALQQKKLRGAKLGTPQNLDKTAKEKGLKVRKDNAKAYKEKLYDIAKMYKDKGLKLQDIATKMNDLGFTSPRGSQLKPTTISRILA